MGRNLTNLPISASFQYLLQVSGSEVNDGLGNDVDSLNISASYATTASYAENVSTPNLQQVTDEGASTTNAISGPRIDLGGSGTNGVLNVYNTSDNEILRATATNVQIGGVSQDYDLAHYGNTSQTGNQNITGAVTASAGFKGDLEGNADTATTASYALVAESLVGGVSLQSVLDTGNTATNQEITLTGTDQTDDVLKVTGVDSVGGSSVIASLASNISGGGENNIFRFVDSSANGALMQMRAQRGQAKIDATDSNLEIEASGDITLDANAGTSDVVVVGDINATGYNVTASEFVGDLDGNAATATSATSATTASVSNATLVNETGDNTSFRMAFVNDVGADGGYEIIYHDEDGTFDYNPSTNTLGVSNIAAASITADDATFTSASIGHLTTVTGSAVIIGDAYVIVNSSATTRYAGIKVYESGSATQTTASLEFDSQKIQVLQMMVQM